VKADDTPSGNGDTAGLALPTAVRRTRVLETVRRQQFASVADLSAAFGVSEVTIRNDLDTLAEDGKLLRVRGGALHSATGGMEAPFELAQDTHAVEKAQVGAVAAALVESGQTILVERSLTALAGVVQVEQEKLLLDVGTTVAAVARAIAARMDLHDLTVFTNGVRVALELEPAIPRVTVLLTGGTLRPLQHSLVNPFGMTILEQVHGHLAVLGCHGIDPEAGITGSNVAETEIERFLLKAAKRRVLVADGSKVGVVSLVHLYGLDDIDLLVTDRSADPTVIAALRERGVEILVAG
jgi:DeoR family transcriptional regulator of aga operon